MEPKRIAGVWFRAVENPEIGIAFNMTQQNSSSRLQSQIDRNLKRAYDDVLNEDVPDRFHELLMRLRKSGGAGGSACESEEPRKDD